MSISRSSARMKLIILTTLFFTAVVGYIARMSISVALKFIAIDYGWDTSQLGNLGGVLLGIFLVGYGISNIFLSPFIDKWGARNVLLISMISWSLTLFLAGALGYLYSVLLLSRFLLGLTQGVLFPSANKVTAYWFSERESARASSVFLSSATVGNVLTPLLLTPLIISVSWNFAFYFAGLLGFVLAPFVAMYIKTPLRGDKEERALKTSSLFRTLLTSRNFVGVLTGYSAGAIIWWGLAMWLPTYLMDAVGVPAKQMSYAPTLPYLGGLLGLFVASWISDVTGRRKSVVVASFSLSTLFIIILALINTSSWLVADLLFFLIFFTADMMTPVFFALLQARVPREMVGSATGLMNGVGNGMGVIGPVLIGAIYGATHSYGLGILSMGFIAMFGVAMFHILYKEKRRLLA